MRSQVPVDDGPAPATPALAGSSALTRGTGRGAGPADVAGGEDRPARRGLGRRGSLRRGGRPAPGRHGRRRRRLEQLIRHGLGQLTRPFGTAPVDPVVGARSLAALAGADRRGAAGSASRPWCTRSASPASPPGGPRSTRPRWAGAPPSTPTLVEEMAGRIGRSMRAAGVHQGLAPVLDVTRDYRWGRTEETIGEDPYLVGTIGAAYVRGLERAGIVATLKHFAGYSASRGGRNLAPVSMGRRELADVILPPFEMALRLGGARSVMHSYAEIDGVPVAADDELLTGLLRDEWGFTGTVVADYFASRSWRPCTGSPPAPAEAAGLALRAGIDVELPTVDAFGAPLVAAVRVRRGRRGAHRPGAAPGADPEDRTRPARRGLAGPCPTDVDEPAARRRGQPGRRRRLARESVVLLRNDGILPLRAARVALIGPVADEPMALLGCYSFPNHVGVRHPELPARRGAPHAARGARRAGRRSCHRGAPVTDGTPRASRRRSPRPRGRRVRARARRPAPACSAVAPPARAATPTDLRAARRAGGTGRRRAGHRHADRRWCW